MKETTKKIIILVCIFVALNAVMALKYFQIKRLTESFPNDSIIGKGKPVLLELGSRSCPPCIRMLPFLNELNTEQTAFVVSYIDVWADNIKGNQYGVEITPTQIFFDGNGEQLFRHVGFYSKEEILDKWKQLGVE